MNSIPPTPSRTSSRTAMSRPFSAEATEEETSAGVAVSGSLLIGWSFPGVADAAGMHAAGKGLWFEGVVDLERAARAVAGLVSQCSRTWQPEQLHTPVERR